MERALEHDQELIRRGLAAEDKALDLLADQAHGDGGRGAGARRAAPVRRPARALRRLARRYFASSPSHCA